MENPININNTQKDESNEEKEIKNIYGLDNIIEDQENNENKELESLENNKKKFMKDFALDAKNRYDKFDEESRKKGEGYKIPNFPEIEKRLEGVDLGLYVFSGESNSGKTAIMLNIVKSMATCKTNKLVGVIYSLDDTFNEVTARIISMDELIPIAVSAKPVRYEKLMEICENDETKELYREQLEKRQHGLETLKEESDVFNIFDATDINFAEDLKEHMKAIQTYVKRIDPDMNIVVAIDSFNDIKFNKRFKDENDENDTKAQYLKDIVNELGIIMFVSAHMRKLNANRRPVLDDIKNANRLVYEASLIWLVYNDVSKNKQAASIYWDDSMSDDNYGAILELDWAKNKKSSYKGRTFNMFKPYYSKCVECDKELMKNYELQIYE